MRYVVITPVRNEQDYLTFTIDSMARQTIRPVEWVIVNDGSSDGTGRLIDEYARKHDWIRAVHRGNRGFRKYGGGIIEAFYAGYDALTCRDWEFMVKLDGDLSFNPDYFANLIEAFARDPRLGIAGGTLYHVQNGTRIIERCPTFHVRGGTKVFRRACWEGDRRIVGGFRIRHGG